MQKSFCAIGFLALVLIFQDCLVPVQSVRVRVVKVKRQDSHYAKRQVSNRNPYTDVPLVGDPDAEQFPPPVNTNNLRPQDNPYNAGNNPVDYPLNNNIPYQPDRPSNNNPDRYYPGSTQNNNNNNNNRPTYADRQPNQNQGPINPSSSPQQKPNKNEEDCPGCGHSIPGEAGVDYPNFNSPPKTSFSCSNQQYSGYYADVEARCQVFWICQKNRADAFLCPNGTIFNQQVFVCDWWFNFDCNTAADYYSRNQYLYAGPTVDLFGNQITPYRDQEQAKRPVRLQTETVDSEISQSRPPAVTPQKRPAPVTPQRQNVQPVRQQAPRQQQPEPVRQQAPRQQEPVRQQAPRQQQPARQQQQTPQRQTTQVIVSGGYSSTPSGGYTTQVSNRRNDDYATTTEPPFIRRPQQPQQVVQQQKDYNRNDRLKQGQNSYPVPGNSLAAVDGDFGLKMNNIKAAVEYPEPVRQRQYDQTEEERRFKAEQERNAARNKNNRNPAPAVPNQNGGYPNQGGYSTPQNRGGYSNSQQVGYSTAPSGGYSSNSGGYSSPPTGKYTQTEAPIRLVSNAEEQLPRQPLYSSYNKAPATVAYGQKLNQRGNLKTTVVQQDDYVDQQEASSYSSEVPSAASSPSAAALYSSTTKRNAIDYDTENTTPLTVDEDDEDLVATVSSLRYGETAPKAAAYSTEVEAPVSAETTTTPAPLTFGQKLTRAARKRNTSNWGNWRTMLLGEGF